MIKVKYVDNSGFIDIYENNINGNYDKVKEHAFTKALDSDTITFLGYVFKVSFFNLYNI